MPNPRPRLAADARDREIVAKAGHGWDFDIADDGELSVYHALVDAKAEVYHAAARILNRIAKQARGGRKR